MDFINEQKNLIKIQNIPKITKQFPQKAPLTFDNSVLKEQNEISREHTLNKLKDEITQKAFPQPIFSEE